LIDAAMREHFGQPFDADALVASRGHVNTPLLHALKAHAFFAEPFPKTTGPELFGAEYVAHAVALADVGRIAPTDLLATLTRFSAETIAEAVHRALAPQNIKNFTLYASGGGAHNPLLMRWLRDLLPCRFSRTDALGINGDAKEAVLFAVLANETIAGSALDFGERPGVPSVTLGKISLPR
jgi:anhydro-N-acetylmuramic acid kinase